MTTITLKVQKFPSIEEVNYDPPYTTRSGLNEWEVDTSHLWLLLCELGGVSSDELTEGEKILVRRIKGAAKAALKETGGWRSPIMSDITVQQGEKTLLDYGLMAIRYVSENKPTGGWVHKSIDLKFKDGQEISCPSEVEVLWASGPYIAAHLNDISFHGGGWQDKTNWGVFDNLF